MMWGYGPHWGMMGWGLFGLFHLISWIIILGVIIAGVSWLMRTMPPPGAHHSLVRRSSGLDVLEERYARGEINREEYLQKKQDLSG